MRGLGRVLEVSADNFKKEVLESKTPAIVDYYADWCGPCHAMAPTFEKVAGEMKEMKFAKCNIDANKDLAQENGIMSIPCIVVYKDGQEAGRIVGNQQEDALVQQLRAFL
jgi:thioredoxin 1